MVLATPLMTIALTHMETATVLLALVLWPYTTIMVPAMDWELVVASLVTER
jgi:hypothetical protein